MLFKVPLNATGISSYHQWFYLARKLAQGSAQRRRQASRVAAANIAEDEDDVYGSRATEARSPLASGSNEDGAEGEEGLASSEEEDLPMIGKLYPE